MGFCVPKSIEMIFPKRNVRIPAVLLEKEAPETCEAVWSVLTESDDPSSLKNWPENGATHHAKWVGPEIFVFLPQGKKRPPVENSTYRPIPGDIMLFLIPEKKQYAVKIPGEQWDFAVFYDRGANLKAEVPNVEDEGWKGSRFAKVPNVHLDALLDVGNKISFEGTEPMLVRRLPA